MGLLSPGCMVPTGVFSCLEFDVMREVNYSCLMMPQTGPALRGAFCFARPQLAASSIPRPLPRLSLSDLRDQLFDDDVPE